MVLKVKVGGTKEVEISEPVSPTGQYLNSSVLSISIISVLEFDNPIDDSCSLSLINDLFLPINPRFSSIMVEDKDGGKHWKRVQVKVEDHITVPHFPEGLSSKSYDQYFNDYLSKVAKDPFPQTRPLWEIHIFKYPTSNASGSLVFKLHHALGDGYSLMGALLSCLKRADNPSLPLTFPNIQKRPKPENGLKTIISGVLNTVLDFGWSLVKSSLLEDCRTPIRSGKEGVEFQLVDITTMTFSLDQVKKIKDNLQVTINDVIAGVIFLGTRLYMESTSDDPKTSRCTALVLLNTRTIGGYTSVDDMLHNPEAKNIWGNQFAFLHVSLPELQGSRESVNPLKFVYEAHDSVKRKKNSLAVYFVGKLLELIRKCKGPEAASKYIHATLKNSSFGLTNLVGPVEKMTLSNQPIKGFYFMVVNSPQSYVATIVSYMNELRVALGTEKGFIDPIKLRRCNQEAYDMILKATLNPK